LYKMAEANNQVNLAALNQQMKNNPKAGAAKQVVFLDPVINYDSITCANVTNPSNTNWKPFFHANPSKSAAIVSEDDPQFCVKIEFKDQVELTRVVLSAKNKPALDDQVHAPKEIWFIANNIGDLDFDTLNENSDLDDNKQRNKFGFSVPKPEEFYDHEEVEIKLPAGRFKGVTNMVVFFKMNAACHVDGDDSVTFLNNMRFVGKPSGNKDISAWEPCKS